MNDNTSVNFPFSKEYQYQVLKLMILDDTFMVKCSSFLKEEYFEDKYLSWVFRTIVRYYEEYGRPITTLVLENEARKYPVDKQQPYIDSLNFILNVKNVDEQYVRRELTGFIRRNIFTETFKKAANLYNVNNNESAYEFTKEKIDELIAVDFEADNIVHWDDAIKYVEESKRLSLRAVPTGISYIDNVMNGGMTPGSLTTLIAPTNAGKSMVLVNIGYHALLAGKKIVTIHHEDDELSTVNRVISRFTGIPYNKLLCSDRMLEPIEIQKIELIKKKLKDNWVMKFMYGSDTAVEDVRDWLKLRKKEFNFDLVIDDYGQFIRTKKKTENERFTQTIVYRTLKQIALELDVAVLTCAQGTREAQKVARKGTDYLKSTDISECFEIARISNNVITLNRSEENSKKDRLIFYLEKQRSGKVGIAVECISNYNKCITHDPGEDRMWLANSTNPLLNHEEDISGDEI